MPTEKLEVFIERVAKLQKATKKKRFAFQLSQLKELAEEVVEARSASLEEPTVGTPATTPADSSSSTSTSSSGATATGTTSTSSSGATATGTTAQQ